jgi:hypothetical protein
MPPRGVGTKKKGTRRRRRRLPEYVAISGNSSQEVRAALLRVLRAYGFVPDRTRRAQ